MFKISNIQFISLSFVPTWGAALWLHHTIGENYYSLWLLTIPFAIIAGMIIYSKARK